MSNTKLKRPLRLCVLASSNEGCEYEGEDVDPPADIAQHLRRGGYPDITVENVFLSPHDYATKLVSLSKRFQSDEIDCFINLCDGAWDEPSCGMSVVDLLEHKLNLPFTGADMKFFEPTRLQMKKVALASGALVPAWRFVYNEDEMEQFLSEFSHANNNCDSSDDEDDDAGEPPLKFPLLVKHFSSYSSVGLTKESKVWDVDELRTQCKRMLDTYGGCLIEEFIIGREFTVLVSHVPSPDSDTEVDVVAYDPVECSFGQDEDFKHFNLKWVDYDNIAWNEVKTDDETDLKERLKQMARNIFRGIDGRGYGRLDVRSDPTGEHLYFLEINPNCGIFYPEGFYGSADFILDRVDPMKAHARFILDQVEVAMRLWRQADREKNGMVEARYDSRTSSWGLYALRDFNVDDVIVKYEEKPFHLVSKRHILATWKDAPVQAVFTADTIKDPKRTLHKEDDKVMRSWSNFASYCWPVSDEIFAMWSPDPDDWKPVNHSCDPNAWNEIGNGLNLVARKFIKAGDEICMDYATFTGYFPDMKSFTCKCKSNMCRRQITGMDIVNKPELALLYWGHMSSYIAAKAKEIHGNTLFCTEEDLMESSASSSGEENEKTGC